uniref:Telomerase reverse transcriptase n=1 Tax=Petromyzon marinus TaxID=7757 RepID=A0AAJ7X666_PETMA|nr:telomerase reverse transcriptase [Petromyzon marinus]
MASTSSRSRHYEEGEEVARGTEAPRQLLRRLYARCAPLGAFVAELAAAAEPGSPAAGPLLRAGDDAGLASLAASVLVSEPRGARDLTPPVSFRQLSSQKELMSRLLQRIRSRGKRNVVAFGLARPCEPTLPSVPKLRTHWTNDTAASMMNDSFWGTLMERMGDQVFEYLVEVCSLFMWVPPSCYYQFCGVPIYDLVVSGRHFSAPNSLCSQRLVMAHSDERGGGGGRRGGGGGDGGRGRGRGARVNPERPDVGTAARRKRKRRPQRNCERQLQIIHKFQMDNETLPKAKTPRLDGEGDVFPNAEPGPNAEAGTGRHAIDLASPWAMAPAKPSPAALPRAHRRRGGGTDAAQDDARGSSRRARTNPGVVFYWHKVMYSHRRREGFPRSHILSRLKVSRSAARNLMREIFELNKRTVAGKGKARGRSVARGGRPAAVSSAGEGGDAVSKAAWRRACRRLPKRFVQMQGFFLELLKRYKKCRVLDIVERHCPVGLPSRSRLTWKRRGAPNNATHLVPSSETTSAPAVATAAPPPAAIVQGTASTELGDLTRPIAAAATMEHTLAVEVICSHGATAAPENCATPSTLQDAGLAPGVYPGCTETAPGETPPPQAETAHGDGADDDASDAGRLDRPLCVSAHASRRRPRGATPRRPRYHCSQVRLFGLLHELLLRVLPHDTWGSAHNRRKVMRSVKRSLGMGHHDAVGLREMLSGVRVKDCAWLHLGGERPSPSEHRKCEELLAQFVSWLMTDFIMEAIRSFFYVTITNFTKNHLLYFRKKAWARLLHTASRKFVVQGKLQELTDMERQNVLRGDTVIPVSFLRFLPKSGSELRPIICMRPRRLGRQPRKKGENVQRAIKSVFAVLNYEVTADPAWLGSSVLGSDDIYRKWRDFARPRQSPARPLYFVKVDIKGAFDSIPQHTTVDVVKSIVGSRQTKDGYIIRKYVVVWANRQGVMQKAFRQQACSSTHFQPKMSCFVSQQQRCSSLHNAIVVEQWLDTTLTSVMVSETLERLLLNNVIIIDQRYYWQRRGISQGSPLSTLLCNLCYAHMETSMLSTVQQDGLLMRFTDDFLLVTPHLDKANHFLRLLLGGMPTYGCTVSRNKTVVNFAPEIDDGDDSGGFMQLPLHWLLPWCGLLLNTRTLEVLGNYSSYSKVQVSWTMSLCFASQPGHTMRTKLMHVLRLKCQPILLDLQINSFFVVTINLYQTLQLQAYRFHACVRRLPLFGKAANNPGFLLSVVEETATCVSALLLKHNEEYYGQVKRASELVNPTRGGRGRLPQMDRDTVSCLCYSAFHSKLSQHRAIYTVLPGLLLWRKKRTFARLPPTTQHCLSKVLTMKWDNILM